uniref:Uncharacterized protein n=1 Tax=Oryza nivara TaxID=4536 RepID=A0A0E0HY22_ORYNI
MASSSQAEGGRIPKVDIGMHGYTGRSCVPLEGLVKSQELIALHRNLILCMFFPKKPYEVFLEFGGYGQSDILIRKSKARVMKPSFTVVRDKSTKSFILFIRGATSVKDCLTTATAAEVPFHHVVLKECRVSNVVVGHRLGGLQTRPFPVSAEQLSNFQTTELRFMVSSQRWIQQPQ